ncbi:MAG: hypothetical protein RIK87_04230 [Fuerstiella sp.]
MNDVIKIARDGVIGALGLIEVLKTAKVQSGVEGTQAELEANIEDTRQHLLTVLEAIDSEDSGSPPNCGARNR